MRLMGFGVPFSGCEVVDLRGGLTGLGLGLGGPFDKLRASCVRPSMSQEL